ERDPASLRVTGRAHAGVGQGGGEVERGEVGCTAVAAGQYVHAVGQREELQGGAADAAESLGSARVEGSEDALGQELFVPEDGRNGRAQLMRERAEEVLLRGDRCGLGRRRPREPRPERIDLPPLLADPQPEEERGCSRNERQNEQACHGACVGSGRSSARSARASVTKCSGESASGRASKGMPMACSSRASVPWGTPYPGASRRMR